VTDTALMLCLRRAGEILTEDHRRLAAGLRALSETHRDTVMLGRTLLQPAAPITFGLKTAIWFSGVARAHAALASAFEDCRVVQLGGPVGTLAAFGAHGPAIGERLATELDLKWPGAPWHAERGRLAALVTASAIYTAALAKIARDISLLMQFEIGEVTEPGGGSSSMPHKRNPAGCAVILAAANRVPPLTAAFLSGMISEHERGLGGWHAEPATIAAIVQTTGSALAAAVDVVTHLTVNRDRMRDHLERLRGVVFGAADQTRAPDDELGSAETFRLRLLHDHADDKGA
jgi:3-carboxy-cis,cis-muconate cycloisomerase